MKDDALLPAMLLTAVDDETADPTVIARGVDDGIKRIDEQAEFGVAAYDVQGESFAVVYAADPIAPDVLEKAVADARTWPEAGDIAAATTGTMIVVPNDLPKDRAGKLAVSLKMSRLVAALVQSTVAPALYWPGSGALVDTQDFVSATAQPELSVGLVGVWVHITWYRADPESEGAPPRLAATTTGLARFIGREIDFLPSGLKASEIAENILFVARYLIMDDVTFESGDTLGFDERPAMRAAVEDQGFRADIPVYRLQVQV